MCGIGANTLQNAPLGAFWSIRALAKTPRLEQKNAPLEQIWGFSALTLEQCSTCGSMLFGVRSDFNIEMMAGPVRVLNRDTFVED